MAKWDELPRLFGGLNPGDAGGAEDVAFRDLVGLDQGERGAFSEDAAFRLLGHDIELVPRRTFADLYDSLDCGVADYLLAPVDNTIAGIVNRIETSVLTGLPSRVVRTTNVFGRRPAAFGEIETATR